MHISHGAESGVWQNPAPGILPEQVSWPQSTGGAATSVVENQKPDPGRAGRRESVQDFLVSSLSFLFSFLILVLFWSKQIRVQFSPLGDQFSLFANSAYMFHPRPPSWFLDGFSHYFHAYPAWPSAGTDFLRPAANAAYYLGSLLSGRHWSWYLLSNYLFQSAIVGLAVLIARRHLKLSAPASLGIGLLCFLSPAFGASEVFSTAFAFDLMASALVLAGLHELLRHRRLAAGLLFTMAIFTKETAFFAPLAAAVVVFLEERKPEPRPGPGSGPRRFLCPLLLLLPYAAWAGIRLAAFHTAVAVYALPRQLSGTLIAMFGDLGRWPFPLADAGGRHHGLPDSLFYGGVSLNFCFWAILAAWLVFAFFHRSRLYEPERSGIRRPLNPAAVVLIFCVLSSAILLLIPHLSARFGATFLPLLFLCLAVAARGASRRGIRIAAWCFLVLPMALGVSGRSILFPGELDRAHLRWAFAADYIHKIADSQAPVIFIADDASGGYSSTDSVARFAGYRGAIVRINNLAWSSGCHFTPSITAMRMAGSGIEISSNTNSACATQEFLGAFPPWDRSGRLTREIDKIGIRMVYRVPTQAMEDGPSALSVSITGIPRGAMIFVPDFTTRTYREIGIASSTRQTLPLEPGSLPGNQLASRGSARKQSQ